MTAEGNRAAGDGREIWTERGRAERAPKGDGALYVSHLLRDRTARYHSKPDGWVTVYADLEGQQRGMDLRSSRDHENRPNSFVFNESIGLFTREPSIDLSGNDSNTLRKSENKPFEAPKSLQKTPRGPSIVPVDALGHINHRGNFAPTRFQAIEIRDRKL